MRTLDPDTAWNGIAALYADAALAQSLLRRQDEEQLDVVLHLFAQWAATQGHALDADALAQADALVAPWRAEVIAPLRALRRSMKTMPADLDSREAVRDKVKAAELAAERAQVQMLCEWLQAR
ncbi:hypothetical protein H6CHR_01109 [Variovorax sp. PBL-H6]|uniref:TIGR02444 family protein n=1 Tax=Variovorax sp. PBL-H6 TaxID=434009 RepID=UPI0013198851|nr:TIGR02444 family protein [Variovorax sp. PBL-H6]VTU19077.1 hypothetical protein H6CHR_01109 [Variovorax sp. PBL-H6]